MNMSKYFCSCAPLNSQLFSSAYRYVLLGGGCCKFIELLANGW
jgi:hypothetical protein